MAKSKLRLTGFARLLLALVVIVPLAFTGAAFVNDTDPITMIKEWAGMTPTVEQPADKRVNESPDTKPAMVPPAMDKKGEDTETVDELRNQLNKMYDENSALKERVKALEAALKKAEAQ